MKALHQLTLIFSIVLFMVESGQAQCFDPSNTAVLAYDDVSVKLDWTSGGANNWQIRYRISGSTGLYTKQNALSKPYVLTGLSANTAYEIQVRDSCSSSNFSSWISFPNPVITACGVVSAPFKANFDGAAWNPTSGAINSCWRRFNSDINAPSWVTGPPGFVSNTGAANDHTTGSDNYVYTDFGNFAATGPDSSVFESPLFDLSPLTTPQLVYWYHMFGADIEDLKVYISTDRGESYQRIDLLSGQQQITTTDPWKERILSLASYTNDTVRFRFVGYEQTTAGFANAICLDDFEIMEQPTCPKPSNLSVISRSNSSFTLNWTTGGASNWELEYGSSGFTPGTGTRLTATTKPFTINGLNANTTYDIYLRDSCGLNDLSVWVGPLNARTNCAPVSTPYTEDFEGSGFNTSSSFNGPGTINSCWTRDANATYFWKVGPPLFSPTLTGPQNDHSPSGTQYFYSEITNFLAPDTAWAETPLIDLGGLSNPQLNYWVHLYGADINALITEIDNGSGWTTLNTQTGQQQNSKTDAWKEIIVNLLPYKDDTIKLRFSAIRSSGGGFSSDIALDDISIAEAPACPRPTAAQIGQVGTSTVELSWTTGGANLWQVEYGVQGFAPGTGTIVNVSNNPTTISGLSPNTQYQFRVRDSCGSSGVSSWTPLISTTTKCTPAVAPVVEDFDGSTFVPSLLTFAAGQIDGCWKRSDTVTFTWNPFQGASPLFNSGPSQDHTSGSGKYMMSARIGFLGNPLSTELTSLPVDLSALTVPELRFYHHLFGNNIVSLEVQIDNGSGYTSLTTISGPIQSTASDPWTEELISLSAYANDTVRIKFISTRNGNFASQVGVAIDDFEIRETPACPRPSSLQAGQVSTNSVELSWTSGGANLWQIEYGVQGFTPGTGTLVNAGSNPTTITGLSPNTQYQFRVRDSCGSSGVSTWTPLISVTTKCTPVTAPVVENFDGSAFAPAPFLFAVGQIDNCWKRSDTVTFTWNPFQGASPLFNSGPDQDHTSGSGNYMMSTRIGFLGNDLSTELVSVPVDMTALTVPELRFYHHLFGNAISSLEIQVDNGSGFTNLTTINGPIQTASSDAWTEEIISLSAYANDTVRIKFISTRTSGFASQVGVAIDDFEIREAPTCPRPTNISSTGSTQNSITLDWTTGGATNWQLQYRQTGTSAWSTVSVSSKPYTLNGLSPSTGYEVRVRDSCGANDVSFYSATFIAYTACGIAQMPFSEDFDGARWTPGTFTTNIGNQIDPCWGRPANDGLNFGPWSGPTLSFNTGPDQDASGTGKFLHSHNNTFNQTQTGVITSPNIAISNSQGVPKLKYAYHMFGSNVVKLEVLVKRQGGNFSLLKTITGQKQTSSSQAWKMDSVSLNNYVGDTIQLRFRAESNGFRGDISIDEVSVRGNGAICDSVSNLSLSNATATTVDVSWTSNNVGATSNIRYYESGQPGSAQVTSAVTSPFTLTGLISETNYTIEVFDDCGQINSSAVADTISTVACDTISGSFSFTTNFLGVSFSSNLSANVDSVFWRFGDGNTDTLFNPFHAYSVAGAYPVKLYIYSDCGAGDTISRLVKVCDTLRIDFSYTLQGDTLQVDASNSQNASGYRWDFGDSISGTGQNKTIVYPQSGTKQVTLTIFNSCGDTLSLTKTVQVCLQPVAKWTYSVLPPVNSGLRLQFDASATQNATVYNWDFGDGNTGTGVQPIHIYSTPGLFYEVTLTVSNACGKSDQYKYKLNEIGLDDLRVEDLQLFPNPTQGEVELRWDLSAGQLLQYHLIDAQGRTLRTGDLSERLGKARFDLNDLPAGPYRLLLLTEKDQLSLPLIKQ